MLNLFSAIPRNIIIAYFEAAALALSCGTSKIAKHHRLRDKI